MHACICLPLYYQFKIKDVLCSVSWSEFWMILWTHGAEGSLYCGACDLCVWRDLLPVSCLALQQVHKEHWVVRWVLQPKKHGPRNPDTCQRLRNFKSVWLQAWVALVRKSRSQSCLWYCRQSGLPTEMSLRTVVISDVVMRTSCSYNLGLLKKGYN